MTGQSATTPRTAIALVGFMGVGKSAVGRLAAARLGLPFIDSDTLIEQRHGDIAEIFATHGEHVFRRLERDEVCAALAAALTHPCVLALGGGAVMSGDVREALRRLSHVVWLTAPVDVLWARVQRAGVSGRPLASEERCFRRLFEERSALYASVATDEVANDGQVSRSEVAAEVARIACGPIAAEERQS